MATSEVNDWELVEDEKKDPIPKRTSAATEVSQSSSDQFQDVEELDQKPAEIVKKLTVVKEPKKVDSAVAGARRTGKS